MENEKEKNIMSNDKIVKNNKLSKRISLIILVVCLTIIMLITIHILFIYPNNCINNINNNYNLQQYDIVTQYSSKLNTIKSYLKSNQEKYNEIQYKVKTSEAIILFENKQFSDALHVLAEIETPDETTNARINDCRYELGKQYLEKKQYDKALEILKDVKNKNDVDNLLDKIYYNLSLKYLSKKDYKKAIEEIEKIKDKKYDKLEETKKQIHYEYGIHKFDLKDYDAAIAQLKIVGDYKESKKYTNNAYIAKAEELIEDNQLSAAKKIYDSLSDKANFNGIKASTRKKQLNKAKDMINATGKKYATKTYCESRNVWKYDGRWENWYIDKPDSSEYIDTSLELNEDGTFNIEGIVYFYAFNNFSSLQKYCNARIISRTIEMKNIKNIPSTYKIDKNTKLLYSNGKFSIKYSVKDDYSTNFYNIYSSEVTY